MKVLYFLAVLVIIVIVLLFIPFTATLKISEKTVRNHISNTIQKLEVKGRASAIVELLKLGEITL